MEVLDLKAMAEQAVALHQQGTAGRRPKTSISRFWMPIPALFGPRYYLGLLRLQQGRNADACDYLSQAVTVYPNDLGLLMNFGMALRAAGQAEEAVEIFDRRWPSSPTWPKRFTIAAWPWRDLQRYETGGGEL